MVSWYTPSTPQGVLNLPVAFLMASSVTLICTAAVSQLVFSMPVRDGKDEYFWSIQGDVFSDSLISLLDAMNPVGACSPGFSSSDSSESNAYSYTVSTTI